MTGQGIQIISGGAEVSPTAVVAEVISLTNPKIRITGSTFPRRLQFAGSLQLCTREELNAGGFDVAVMVSIPIAFEFQETDFQSGSFVFSGISRIAWLLPSGITLSTRVFW